MQNKSVVEAALDQAIVIENLSGTLVSELRTNTHDRTAHDNAREVNMQAQQLVSILRDQVVSDTAHAMQHDTQDKADRGKAHSEIENIMSRGAW